MAEVERMLEVTEAQREVPYALWQLDETLCLLSKTLDELTDKLTPIMSPALDEDATGKVEDTLTSQLAEQIRQQGSRAGSLNYRLGQLIRRIEL